MLHLSPPLTAYILFLTALLGLVMGSFLNCLAWRMARGSSILRGRSHCAHCQHTLSPRELIPVLSWLVQKGRCRWCGTPISRRYPAAELLTAVLYVSVLLRYDVTLDALRYLILLSLLLTASLVDLDTSLLPDRLTGAGVLCFLVLAPFDSAPLPQTLWKALGGALGVTLPLLLLVLLADKRLGRETMGGGDLKLLFMLGLYFDWRLNLLLLIWACVLGLLLAVILDKAKPDTPFPFGPALSTAAWLTALFGQSVLRWYLGLFHLSV